MKVLETGPKLSDNKGLVIVILAPWMIHKAIFIWERYHVLLVFPNTKNLVIGCPVSMQVQLVEYSGNIPFSLYPIWWCHMALYGQFHDKGTDESEPLDVLLVWRMAEWHVASPQAATCPRSCWEFFFGVDGGRTHDLLSTCNIAYQLAYIDVLKPIHLHMFFNFIKVCIVGLGGRPWWGNPPLYALAPRTVVSILTATSNQIDGNVWAHDTMTFVTRLQRLY